MNIDLSLPKKLHKALEKEAKDAKCSINAHITKKLERTTPPTEYIDHKLLKKNFHYLTDYLARIPSVKVLSNNLSDDAYWWVKLTIDIHHPLAWQVLQELGFVLNYISIQEPMPTVFKPVSPPPYLNGGPDDCLAWVIESTFNYIDPKWVSETLEGRLPQPVDDESEWSNT